VDVLTLSRVLDPEEKIRYELEEEDLDFLASLGPLVSEDALEAAMDTLEKLAPSQADLLDPERVAPALRMSLEAASLIWRHWRDKRVKLGRPLTQKLAVCGERERECVCVIAVAA